jgi:hypothetical protein
VQLIAKTKQITATHPLGDLASEKFESPLMLEVIFALSGLAVHYMIQQPFEASRLLYSMHGAFGVNLH